MKKMTWILCSLIGLSLVLSTSLFLFFNPNPPEKKTNPVRLKPVKEITTSVTPNPPVNPPIPPNSPDHSTPKSDGSPPKIKQPKLVFGFDMASRYTPQVSQCVSKTYEKPKIIGRYLRTKKGYYSGLTKNEVQYIHKKGAKILPIYNHYTNFIGKKQGKVSAHEAIMKAKQLSLPKGKIIVIDIEPKRKVNADFFVSWTNTLQKAGYKAGIYGDFGDSKLKSIYLEARHKSPSVKATVLWTNSPNEGTLHKPTSFKGKSPVPTKTLIWQYGVDQPCQIDSDLTKSSLLKNLW